GGADAKAEASGGDEKGGEGEGEGTDGFVSFALPPRNADGEEVEVDIPEDLKEDFARLKNGYMRGEAARALVQKAESERDELRSQKDEQEFIDRSLAEDPVGFIMGRVHADFRKGLLMELLADDTLWA